jgi:hypothetical protein
MHVTRFSEAPAYFPPEHFDMRCLRLQGREAGPTDTVWLGMPQLAGRAYVTRRVPYRENLLCPRRRIDDRNSRWRDDASSERVLSYSSI